ncbi:hypothetical protein PVIIG_06403 [Plasmodium vivax India VII]|uniref:Uncharacterized protein n=1 Tax=Plasmodium vivax India VII TaxID=1077284 RepID=A0A0J9S3F6_PLAVI|nr:hypothetical protein PVIIG_06403 [Plasmodium vivax India VII]
MMNSMDSSINITKRCDYLAYWIYNNITKSEPCDNHEQFYERLNDLKKKYDNFHNICNLKNFKIGNEEFDKKKKLYLLGEMLNLIKEEYDNISKLLNPSYKQYFEECANIYNDILTQDKCIINKNYKSELTEFKKNFVAAKSFLNEKGLSITNDLITHDESICQEQSQAVQIEEERPEAQGEGSKQVGAEVSALAGMHTQQAAYGVEQRPKTETESLQTAKENSFNVEGASVAGVGAHPSEPIVPKNVSTVGATLAGSSLFLLMIYKVIKNIYLLKFIISC